MTSVSASDTICSPSEPCRKPWRSSSSIFISEDSLFEQFCWFCFHLQYFPGRIVLTFDSSSLIFLYSNSKFINAESGPKDQMLTLQMNEEYNSWNFYWEGTILLLLEFTSKKKKCTPSITVSIIVLFEHLKIEQVSNSIWPILSYLDGSYRQCQIHLAFTVHTMSSRFMWSYLHNSLIVPIIVYRLDWNSPRLIESYSD